MCFLFVFLSEKIIQNYQNINGFDKFISYSQNITNCGPNGQLNSEGKCECREFGNFSDEIGCYDCRPSCRSGSYCAPPLPSNNPADRNRPNRGHCKCLEGFYRGGNSIFYECIVAVPQITIYYPVRGPVNSVVNFTLRSLVGFTSKQIFCKFNDIITDGVKVSENFVQCTIPEIKPSKDGDNKLHLALSYDRLNWTKTNTIFEVTGLHPQFRITPVYACGIVLIIVGVVFILAYLHYGFTSDSTGATEPLLNRGEQY